MKPSQLRQPTNLSPVKRLIQTLQTMDRAPQVAVPAFKTKRITNYRKGIGESTKDLPADDPRVGLSIEELEPVIDPRKAISASSGGGSGGTFKTEMNNLADSLEKVHFDAGADFQIADVHMQKVAGVLTPPPKTDSNPGISPSASTSRDSLVVRSERRYIPEGMTDAPLPVTPAKHVKLEKSAIPVGAGAGAEPPIPVDFGAGAGVGPYLHQPGVGPYPVYSGTGSIGSGRLIIGNIPNAASPAFSVPGHIGRRGNVIDIRGNPNRTPTLKLGKQVKEIRKILNEVPALQKSGVARPSPATPATPVFEGNTFGTPRQAPSLFARIKARASAQYQQMVDEIATWRVPLGGVRDTFDRYLSTIAEAFERGYNPMGELMLRTMQGTQRIFTGILVPNEAGRAGELWRLGQLGQMVERVEAFVPATFQPAHVPPATNVTFHGVPPTPPPARLHGEVLAEAGEGRLAAGLLQAEERSFFRTTLPRVGRTVSAAISSTTGRVVGNVLGAAVAIGLTWYDAHSTYDAYKDAGHTEEEANRQYDIAWMSGAVGIGVATGVQAGGVALATTVAGAAVMAGPVGWVIGGAVLLLAAAASYFSVESVREWLDGNYKTDVKNEDERKMRERAVKPPVNPYNDGAVQDIFYLSNIPAPQAIMNNPGYVNIHFQAGSKQIPFKDAEQPALVNSHVTIGQPVVEDLSRRMFLNIQCNNLNNQACAGGQHKRKYSNDSCCPSSYSQMHKRRYIK